MLTTIKNSRKIGRKTQYLRQNMKWRTLLLISEIPLQFDTMVSGCTFNLCSTFLIQFTKYIVLHLLYI